MPEKSPLSKTALRLRNGNPDAFQDFVSQINDLTIDAMKALSEAPTDEILVMQGRAKQCRWFLRLLVECDKEPAQQSTP